MFLIVTGQFRFRDFFGKSLIYQFLLISVHNQRFPVILHQLVYFIAVGNIALSFLVQQYIFRPVTDIMFGKQQTVILRQIRGKHRLQVLMVKEVAI